MKKILFLILLAFGNLANAQSNLTIFNNGGQQFYVILNGIKQNSVPQTNVVVSQIKDGAYSVKLIFADGKTADIDKNFFIDAPSDITTKVTFKKGKGKLQLVSMIPTAGGQMDGAVTYRPDNSSIFSDSQASNTNVSGNGNMNINANGNSTQSNVNSSSTNTVSTQTNNASINSNQGVNTNANVSGNTNGTANNGNVQTTTSVTTTNNTNPNGNVNMNVNMGGTGMKVSVNDPLSGGNLNLNMNLGIDGNVNSSSSSSHTTTVTTTSSSSTTNGVTTQQNSSSYNTTTSGNPNGNVSMNSNISIPANTNVSVNSTNSNVNNNQNSSSNNFNSNNSNQTISSTTNSNGSFINCKKSLGDVNAFIKDLKSQTFEDDRIEIIKKDLEFTCVTSQQAYKIIEVLTFEANRMDVAQYLYFRTSDRQNSEKGMLPLFTFDSSKMEWRDFVRQANN
jgi:hypothetical protein